jgi:hypothetical protein
MNDVHVIDYGHVTGGVLYHATVSDLSGDAKATWTYETADGQAITLEDAIDTETFDVLWNGFSEYDVFARHVVAGSGTVLDPVASHVIGRSGRHGW